MPYTVFQQKQAAYLRDFKAYPFKHAEYLRQMEQWKSKYESLDAEYRDYLRIIEKPRDDLAGVAYYFSYPSVIRLPWNPLPSGDGPALIRADIERRKRVDPRLRLIPVGWSSLKL